MGMMLMLGWSLSLATRRDLFDGFSLFCCGKGRDWLTACRGCGSSSLTMPCRSKIYRLAIASDMSWI